MKIVSNNFYLIDDNELLIIALNVGANTIPIGSSINFFVDNESIGQTLSVTTIANIFEYEIVGDTNELQQIYNLKMNNTGLVSNIRTFIDTSQLVDGPSDLQFNTSTTFKDYDFWFSRQELKVSIPNNETVDSIEEIYSENIKQYNFNVTALQNTQELVIFTEENPKLNLSSDGFLQFKVLTNGNTYTTENILVTPGNESLSECIVSGTFFEGDYVISESKIKNQNMSIVLSLRFETWIDDLQIIRSELQSIIQSEVLYAADSLHFQSDRPPPVNQLGTSALISNANVTRTSEQIVTITFDRNIDIIHPETVAIQHIPPNLIRSGMTNIPILVPYSKLIFPSPGTLEVITVNGDIMSEKDFWTGPTRIILRANDDVWQDPSLLTPAAHQSFHDHIRSSLTSESNEWTNFIQSLDFSITSLGSDLFVDIPQQTSSDFNITSVIEVSVSVDLLTSSGLPTRLSNNNLAHQNSFFIVKPVESFITIDRDLITEEEMWTSDIRISFRLLDDLFVTDSDTIISALRTQFDQTFPSNQISQNMTIENFKNDSFFLLIQSSHPKSFNINIDTPFTIEFTHSFFRNRTVVYSPRINFVTTPVVAQMAGTDFISAQNIIQGFSFDIELINNSWNTTSTNVLQMFSRSDEPNGWNRNVTSTFIFDSDSKLIVNVQPTPEYIISNVEIIDVYIQKDSTYNQKLHYVGNFTIQGSSLVERNHHDYNKNIQKLLSEIQTIKKSIHSTKLSLSSSPVEFDTQGNFEENDTLHQRLFKLNSSEIEHPISVCRPPLINGNESSYIHTLITNSFLQLKNYNTPRAFPAPLCAPVVCPDFVNEATDGIYTILLSRPLPISITLDGTTSNLPTSQVHTVSVLHTHQELTITGEGIQTTSFHRAV